MTTPHRGPESGPGNGRPLLQDLMIAQLEREPGDMREQNQSIAEKYEAALEALKSANAEPHPVNEELQSSNEELEASKQEVQSVNEARPLRDVLREEPGPFMDEGRDNIALGGPAIFQLPKGALALGMVVHALATNAVKYGSLSTRDGTVAIEWEFGNEDGRDPRIWSWHEQGCPVITQPGRRGFGRSVIEPSLTHEMNGRAQIEFRDEGVRVRLVVPLDPLVLARATIRAAPAQ